MDEMKRLSVLMPVYNEARTLDAILDRVLAAPVDLEIEIVAVDDGSVDDSVEILRKRATDDDRVKVVVQPHNMGKGRAIRTAIEHVTGDVAIVQDADLEYDPTDYPKILGPILSGTADAVYGSRFAASPERRVLLFWHAVGNRLLTALSNMANNINLTDMETCYKAVRVDVLKQLRLTTDRFGFEPEITARLAQWGARLYEVPISYHGRSYVEGKNIGWRDGLQALWLIAKFRFVDTRPVAHSGRNTLEGLARVPSVARWTLEQFDGALGDDVFEAGCGLGSLTSHLLDRRRITAVDMEPFYVADLQRKYGHLRNASFRVADLENPDTYLVEERYDSVVCVNVLEHLDDPDRALVGFRRVLRPGGWALILVPAHGWLFSAADEALEHRKRYSENVLRDELLDAGFDIVSLRQFNRLGVLGWWINKQLGRIGVAPWQAKLFALLLPVARMVESVTRLPGLSLVAVARNPE